MMKIMSMSVILTIVAFSMSISMSMTSSTSTSMTSVLQSRDNTVLESWNSTSEQTIKYWVEGDYTVGHKVFHVTTSGFGETKIAMDGEHLCIIPFFKAIPTVTTYWELDRRAKEIQFTVQYCGQVSITLLVNGKKAQTYVKQAPAWCVTGTFVAPITETGSGSGLGLSVSLIVTTDKSVRIGTILVTASPIEIDEGLEVFYVVPVVVLVLVIFLFLDARRYLINPRVRYAYV